MRHQIRTAGALLPICVGVGLVGVGCKASDQLSSRDVVVHLKDGTTEAQNRALVAKCGTVPHASPAPLNPRLKQLSIRFREARFVVSPGTNGNLNRLYECFNDEEFASYFLFAVRGDM